MIEDEYESLEESASHKILQLFYLLLAEIKLCLTIINVLQPLANLGQLCYIKESISKDEILTKLQSGKLLFGND